LAHARRIAGFLNAQFAWKVPSGFAAAWAAAAHSA
jgi:hypothetical protein